MNGFASISLLERDFAKQLRVNTKVTHKNKKSEQVTRVQERKMLIGKRVPP